MIPPKVTFDIIQDTKEKTPWILTHYRECTAQIVQHLDTGDYTVKDYEQYVCVERKRTTGELAMNLGKKFTQFESELQRMTHFPFRFLVCEFPLTHIDIFPQKSDIPKYRWKTLRMTGKFIKKRFFELIQLYEIQPVFATDRFFAQTITIELLSSIIQGLKNGKTEEEILLQISGEHQQDSLGCMVKYTSRRR